MIQTINKCLRSFGTLYNAEQVIHSDELIIITGPGNFTEVFLGAELLTNLEKCNSAAEVTELIERSELAL